MTDGERAASMYTLNKALIANPEYQQLAAARRALWRMTYGSPFSAAWRDYANKMVELEAAYPETFVKGDDQP